MKEMKIILIDFFRATFFKRVKQHLQNTKERKYRQLFYNQPSTPTSYRL